MCRQSGRSGPYVSGRHRQPLAFRSGSSVSSAPPPPPVAGRAGPAELPDGGDEVEAGRLPPAQTAASPAMPRETLACAADAKRTCVAPEAPAAAAGLEDAARGPCDCSVGAAGSSGPTAMRASWPSNEAHRESRVRSGDPTDPPSPAACTVASGFTAAASEAGEGELVEAAGCLRGPEAAGGCCAAADGIAARGKGNWACCCGCIGGDSGSGAGVAAGRVERGSGGSASPFGEADFLGVLDG